jgi:hypothetical protein
MKLFEKWEYDDFVAIEVVLLNIRIKLVKINVMKIVILITNIWKHPVNNQRSA